MYSLRIVAVSVLSHCLVDAIRIGEDDALAPKTHGVHAKRDDLLLDDTGVGPGHPSQKVKHAGLLQAAEDSHDYEDDYAATETQDAGSNQPCADGTNNAAAAPAAPSNGPASSLQQGAQAQPAQPCPAAAAAPPPPCRKEETKKDACGDYDYDSSSAPKAAAPIIAPCESAPCNPCDQSQQFQGQVNQMAQVARNALDALAQTQRELADVKKDANALKAKEQAEFKKKLADVEGEEEARAELAEEKRIKQTLADKADAERDRNKAAAEKAEAQAMANFTATVEKEAEEKAKLKEQAREEARAELIFKDRQQSVVKEGKKEAEKAKASQTDAIAMIKSEEAKERKMVDAMKGMKADLEKSRAKDKAKADALSKSSSSMAEIGKKTSSANKSKKKAKAKAKEEEPLSPNTASLSRHSAKDILEQLEMKK